MTEHTSVRSIDGKEARARIEELADVLIDCVEGGASVSFMLPLPREKALGFWSGVADSVARAERTLLIAEDRANKILGTVQLITALPENQPHRGEVAKMLVHRAARRSGLGRRLLAAVEDAARNQQKSLLVLDTVTGMEGERLYASAGWQRVGVVPKFALMPDGEFCATTFFFKQL